MWLLGREKVGPSVKFLARVIIIATLEGRGRSCCPTEAKSSLLSKPVAFLLAVRKKTAVEIRTNFGLAKCEDLTTRVVN